MTKSDGARLAAVLPADTQFDIRTNLPAVLNSHPYESSYPFGVKYLKGIVG